VTQSYTFLEDQVISDMVFEATGDTPAELFQAAGLALFEGMADTGRVQPRIRKEIRLKHAQIDQLLYDWLSELIYLKDAAGLLFREFSVQLSQNGELKQAPGSADASLPAGQAGAGVQGAGEEIAPSLPERPPEIIWELVATVRGEPIDPKRHALRADVKAVTYHQFEVVQTETGGWKARVVVDI
jgi:SHS2 domain-containing protein